MDIEQNKEDSACCCGMATPNDATVPDSLHKNILRIIGVFTLVVGIAEIGLGGGVYAFFLDGKEGSFWAGIGSVLAAIAALISLDRSWVVATNVFSWVALILCLAGAIVDGLNLRQLNTLTACSTSSSYFGPITHYGESEDYHKSDQCLLFTSYKADACFCTTGGGGKNCLTVELSSYAKDNGDQNCGDVLTTFPEALLASTILCVICLVLVFALGITSSVVLCGKRKANQEVEIELPGIEPTKTTEK